MVLKTKSLKVLLTSCMAPLLVSGLFHGLACYASDQALRSVNDYEIARPHTKNSTRAR